MSRGVTRRALRTGCVFSLAWATLLVGMTRSAGAQEEEALRGRMEFERLRLYSGPGVNLARQLQAGRAELLRMGRGPLAPLAAPLETRWRALGPDRITTGVITTAGRVSAIAIHPTNASVLYVGAAQGGVWRSNDQGASWTPLTDDQCSLAMGSIAIDPVDPDIVYAGTGEQHFSGDSYYGCGVLRSLDGGSSWQHLGADIFVSDFGGARIARVLIDPVTAGSPTQTTVLAATTFGLFRSTNSGTSWVEVLGGVATDLVRDPTDPALLYAAVRQEGVFRSMDGGLTWSNSGTGLPTDGYGRINLALAPSSPATLYASMENRQNGALLGIYRTDDGGSSWLPLEATNARCGNQCWYDMTLAVHPLDPDRVYFGGISLYRSDDGGQSFILRPIGYVDQHLLVFDPRNPDLLYGANDGGVYRSTDAGDTWTSLATNLAVAQFYPGISMHPVDPSITLGGTQDQGTLQASPATTSWEKVLGGDGGSTAIDPEDPTVRYAEIQWVKNGIGGPRKAAGGAFLWSAQGIDTGDDALFLPPLVMDPVESQRLYFATDRLYRTDDAAQSWVPISPVFEGVLTAVAPSRTDPRTVFVTSSSGAVHVTRDGGDTWLSASAGLPQRFLSDVAVHPTDPNRAYVTAGGFQTGHVFSTTDGGRTWMDRSGTLPDLPTNAVLYDPGDPDEIYVGTDLGVFHSPQGGGTWNRLDDGMPMVAVFDLAVQAGSGRLVAATHGRGMFELPIRSPLTALVRPTTVVDSATAGASEGPTGSIVVAPYGEDDGLASWTVDGGAAPWLVLSDATGTGRGRFGWRVSAAELEPGTYQTTLTVRVDGVVDSIAIPLSVSVEPGSRMALSSNGVRVDVLVGDPAPIEGSVDVTFDGPTAATRNWTATHTGASWLTLTTAQGTGNGTVEWGKDPSGLQIGEYVDTIMVASQATSGSPATFVDTLAVLPALAVEPDRQAAGYGIAGATLPSTDSLPSGLTGFGADTAQWIAEAGSEWLSLDRAAGRGSEAVTWTRSSDLLPAGLYEDTITIRVPGRDDLGGHIIDRFEVVTPFTPEQAAHSLLGLTPLTSGQRAFLDRFGNGTGQLDAGDVLAWLDHCSSGSAAGCLAQAPAAARDQRPGGEP